MSWRDLKISSVAPAILLSVVILSLFYVLRGYGPESAIRQFHRAVQVRDVSDIDKLTTRGSGDQDVRILSNELSSLLRSGNNYQIRRVQRSGDNVLAAVEYRRANGPIMMMVWVVEKPTFGTGWRVNASKTLNLLRNFLDQ